MGQGEPFLLWAAPTPSVLLVVGRETVSGRLGICWLSVLGLCGAGSVCLGLTWDKPSLSPREVPQPSPPGIREALPCTPSWALHQLPSLEKLKTV